MTSEENKELEQLRELFEKSFKVEMEETPSIVAFNKALADIHNKQTIKEFARILSLYKNWFIEQSMKIFPMTVDEMNYRNWVVIEIGKLISVIEWYATERPDPVFRDKGQLASDLSTKNNLLA